jgi:hypothetical protein
MKTYTLHVGANNATGELEKEKLCAILSTKFPGFTVRDVVGYWNGKQEQSCEVLIANVADEQRQFVLDVASEIAQKLEQEAVGVMSYETPMEFMS